jgi:hypothetical protein
MAMTPCIEWTKALNSKGYGVIWVGSKLASAHRVAWEQANGLIPDGMYVDHLCKNRACYNVEHLRLVTARQNTIENSDSVVAANLAKECCPKCSGPFTYRKRKGRLDSRYCRPCFNLSRRVK